MQENSKITTYALLLGCVYFTCMALAHFFGIKQPFLFVYYDTPYHAYQDKIISFAVSAYIGLFYIASRCRAAIPVALAVTGITAAGLTYVNLSDALADIVPAEPSMNMYWLQTACIAAYGAALTLCYLRDGKRNKG